MSVKSLTCPAGPAMKISVRRHTRHQKTSAAINSDYYTLLNKCICLQSRSALELQAGEKKSVSY